VSFALVVLLVPAQGAVAQTVYKEGNFDLTNWSLFGPFPTPEGTEDNRGAADARAPISGGNSGGYLRFSVTGVTVPIGSSTVTWALLINDQAEYDPGSLGALERVDFDFDGRVPPEDRLNRVVTLAVEQGGFRWAAIDTRLFLDEKSWLSKWILGLQAEDFVALSWAEEDQPVNPDFSSTASPIKFGILTGTSCPTTSDCSATPPPKEVDIDNWRVAVNETDLSLRLSVAETDSPGPLGDDYPLQFRVSARVRKTTSPDLNDLTVRFLLPKEELAEFTIPEDECVPDSASRNDFVIADCTVLGPVGPGSTETVEVPTTGISVGYAAGVPAAPPVPDAGPPPPSDRAVFTYKAGVLPLTGTDPDPANDIADLVDVVVCNPSGFEPVTVGDITDCDDLMTGGTSGAGGAGGAAGSGGAGVGAGDGSGCNCNIATNEALESWLLILCSAGVALWLRRRVRW
jgi:hypothetical protein